MTNPSHPPVAANLKPYTADYVWDHAHFVAFKQGGTTIRTIGLQYKTAGAELANLLNAAYTKGIETERARCVAETGKLPAPHGLNAARLINLTAPDPDRLPPDSPFTAISPASGMTDELRAAITGQDHAHVLKLNAQRDRAEMGPDWAASQAAKLAPQPPQSAQPTYLISEREPVFNGFSLWFHHTGWGLDDGSWHQLDEAAYVTARDHGHVYDQWSPNPPKSALPS